MKPSDYPVVSDMSLLAPAFSERMAAALKALQGQGYRPHVHETLRTKERAEMLVRTGKSKAKGGLSMHCLGLACDVICGDHNWDCQRNHCRFFETLGVCAEDVDLCWGGRWPNIVDLPHCQAVPLRLQDRVRAMPAEHLDTFVRSYLAGLVRS